MAAVVALLGSPPPKPAAAANGSPTSVPLTTAGAIANRSGSGSGSGVASWKRGELRAMSLRGEFDRVKRLVDEGVDIESRDAFNGRTALLCGVYGARYDVIEYLVLKGANLEAKDKAGHSLRDYTASHKTMKTDLDPQLVAAAISRGLTKKRVAEALNATAIHITPITDLIALYC